MFDLNKTDIYTAIKLEKLFLLVKAVKMVLLLGTIVSFGFFVFTLSNNYLELFVLLLSLFAIFKSKDCFFEECMKINSYDNILLDKQNNLAELLNFKSAKIINQAIDYAQKRNLKYPNSTILLYFFLFSKKNPKISFIFSRLLIDWEGIKDSIKGNLENQLPSTKEEFEAIVAEALNISTRREGKEIKEGDIIASLAKIEPNLKTIISESYLDEQDFEKVNSWMERVDRTIKKRKTAWDYENLLKAGSLGRDWSAGYTPTLESYSIDWSDQVKRRGYEEIIGHKDKVPQVERILSKKEAGNALIIGDPGSGRKNIVHGLIRKCLLKQSDRQINDCRFLELDIISLSTNISSYEQMERILDQCFLEAAQAGNVILIINDFHDFLGGEKKAGIVDVSGIIGPYLNSPRFKTICLTSFDGLHKYIEKKPSILALFQKIEVEEMNKDETLEMLESKVFDLEYQYQKFIPFTSLKEIITVCEKYISSYPFPQKAINLLEETTIYSGKLSDSPVVLPEHVDKILSEKTQIPIGKIKSIEKEVLLNLESILHKRIIAQEEAIKEISSALRRARTGIQTRKGPMGSFLFLGPTGVGKTETAKALAETYFGSEDKMVRIDMSEFQRLDDIPRLLGSETQEGILTTQVKENPFSLVLLDEIEKAHPDILNLFLQVLDEGYVNDNMGRKVSFTNTIIIATSNAGYQIILKAINEGKQMSEIKKDLLNYIFEKGTFRPEFINRFDGTIIFKSLSKDDLSLIAQLQLDKVANNLKQKKINLIITEELKQKIVDLSYDPVFGAREMKRVIQDKIENAIAKALLSDSIPNGAQIQIDPIKFEVVILG
ncbi:MAG: ATP-dependent Clp protease ATP-binding subunit [Candidatus Pacebacteria bacterium]|nr:ATP-dependent Clp protease ATP-binding subunit [Candidatus Paceibacterota bacterium]